MNSTMGGDQSYNELIKPSLYTIFRKKKEQLSDPNELIEKLCKKKSQGSNKANDESSNEEENKDDDGNEEDMIVSVEDEEDSDDEEIKGMKIIESKSMEDDTSLVIYDKNLLVMSKLPSGIILKCLIKRSEGILNKISPEFDLYLANGLKHVLSAKKYPWRNR